MISDYRSWLRKELGDRQSRNPRYSLRSFAGKIGVSPALLSRVLNHKHHLTPQSAAKVIRALRLTALEEEELQKALIAESQARAPRTSTQPRKRTPRVAPELFETISNWPHFALTELVDVKDFNPDPQWIAERLGISKGEAEVTLDRLLKLGFLKRQPDGKLTDELAFVTTGTGTTNLALQAYHGQLLKKSIDALTSYAFDERDVTSITICTTREKFNEAKNRIRRFRHALCQFLATPEGEDVYHVVFSAIPARAVSKP